MTTLVSGFISIANKNRSIEKYIELGRKFLSVDVPKVVFLERDFFEALEIEPDEKTKIIFFEREELPLWKRRDEILKIPIDTPNKDKDTHDYLIVQNEKTYFMKKASELNPFSTSCFAWIDFGIFHIMKDNFTLYQETLKRISKYSNRNNKIRIPGCIQPQSSEYNMVVNVPCWVFCGGFFYGTAESIEEFHNLCHKKLEILINDNIFTWEINLWYLVYKDNPELFDWYLANHNAFMLLNLLRD